ncbi:hypothetical protein PoB_005846400 [Plakobranchus ocellatus]|uniref:Uncharacterized protein n=1 Tax=Plakobranchus ocellatus TaxID=259542 RepID=A0AAV4CL32_9GAST|nr:hypothetical protein PoB_005846400 [Plakobranchus ocellatus]
MPLTDRSEVDFRSSRPRLEHCETVALCHRVFRIQVKTLYHHICGRLRALFATGVLSFLSVRDELGSFTYKRVKIHLIENDGSDASQTWIHWTGTHSARPDIP